MEGWQYLFYIVNTDVDTVLKKMKEVGMVSLGKAHRSMLLLFFLSWCCGCLLKKRWWAWFYGTHALKSLVGCKPCCTALPVKQEGAFVVWTRTFRVSGVATTFSYWCLLAVNCGTNWWAGFRRFVLSCTKTALTRMMAFYWRLVAAIQRSSLTYRGTLILLLHLNWWSI